MAKQITDEVKAVLSGATFSNDGKEMALPPGQLDRKLYVAVNEVLEAAGGRWNRQRKTHLFEADARPKIKEMLGAGEVINERKEAEFFPTPLPLAKALVRLADVRPEHTALEPSAGRGAIAAELLDAGARVECCELLPENRAALKAMIPGGRMRLNEEPDFAKAEVEPVDRVVMNPPFAFEIEHVLKAHSALRQGGRLVSVMSAGVLFRRDKKTTAFRAFVKAHGGSMTENPADSFKESGTNVNTITVMIPA